MLVRIARIDPVSSTYDAVFRAPSERVELDPIDLRAQVEDEFSAFEQLSMMHGGDSPAIRLTLTFHFRDLEAAGYVDPTTGDCTAIRKGDRLVSIHRLDGTLIQAIPTPPGLYVTHAQPRSHGLAGGTRNLLIATLESRDVSSDRGGGG